MSLRSPLGRVLGSGSAKEGTDHFWIQRLTAVALLLLGLWFLVAMIALPDFGRQTVRGWIGEPLNALLLLLLGIALTWHSSLGVQMIIEDYVHAPLLKIGALVASRFAHIIVAAAAVFAVLKTAFGTP